MKNYRKLTAIVPHDTNLLASGRTDAIYVGGAGNVSVKNVDGTVVTFIGVPVGTVLPIKVTVVRSTLTTATNLVALNES